MWLPVDLVLAALLSSAFELVWVAERGWPSGRRRSFRPRHRLLGRTGAGAISRAGVFFPAGELWRELRASAHRSHSRAGRPGGRRGRRSNRCSDWRLVTATSGHTAPAAAQGDPVPGPNQARVMRMLPSGYSLGSCEPATTPPRALAKIVCTHNGDPAGPTAATYTLVAEKASLRPLFDDLPRGSTSSRARETFSRRTLAPQRHAPASQRHAGVQLRPRGGHLGPPGPTRWSATSMPIELGRRSTSSTNGGRRTPDALRPGPPRRLPTPTRRTPRRPRDPQTRFSEGSCGGPPRLRGVA